MKQAYMKAAVIAALIASAAAIAPDKQAAESTAFFSEFEDALGA